MITAEGYSKDPTLMPVGIAVTFGKKMIEDKGGLLKFLKWFESCLRFEDSYWMQRCKNKPKYDDLLYVYVIICNRVHYRCIYGGYEKGETQGFLQGSDDKISTIAWPRIILAAPLVKAPVKIYRGGFQGFRYTTELF